MRTRLLVPLLVSVALPLGACGGSSQKVSASPDASTSTTHVATAASNTPSESARMICDPTAQEEIYQSATGVKTVAAVKPTWVDHVYSCDYMYAGGVKMRLSIKEMSSEAETTAYFDSLASRLHKTDAAVGISNAFQVQDESVVVRKDYKVLLVDVTKLPEKFGVPAATRGDVAINVAATIMGCWTGT